MARIKLAYIGGGSTRAAGTMASFIQQGENFDGSEVVLVDLNEERLGIVQTLAQKMARARDLDLTIRATTNRREGLQDCDAVLTSFRPGGFEARYLDESIPLKYGVIGLNHGSWTVRHLYDGQDFIPLLRDAYERICRDPGIAPDDLKSITPRLDYASLVANARSDLRLLELACCMDSLPSHYFQYYYFKDEILAELQAKPTTRAQDIMASVPDY